ncbi:MATE family efflux transporter [Clostridium sp. AWRP]|uniref:MATE family efflux transporter n=1 Tax=Clostridium sp. AWRP TaxID=2212991 RepID=UPI000FD856E6|nr:MATE family efflux transporter [Clostridium sp. AWRP]AZV56399.1 MATE family efflux transporter [Clostridium sp. AWRP]
MEVSEKKINSKEKRLKVMGEAPVPEALLKLGIPTVIGMIITALYNFTDAYFANGLGTAQTGAIGIAFPISQIISGIGMMIGNGAGVYISRLLGNSNRKRANETASTTLYLGMVLGILIIIIMLIFINPILRGLGAIDLSVFMYTKQYSVIYIATSVFSIFNIILNNIMIGEGASGITMFAMMLSGILNIILCPIMIYGAHMGIRGAAVATALAQAATTIIYIIIILSKKSLFSFSIKYVHPDKKMTAEIFKVGIPVMVFQLLTSISMGVANIIVAKYGRAALAAFSNATRIIALGSYVIFGFTKGFQPFAGYCFGAKKYNRLNEGIKTAIKWSEIFCICFTLILVIFPRGIMALFPTKDINVINITVDILRINGITFSVFGFTMVYAILFLAIGKGAKGAILTIARQGIYYFPVILILPIFLGLNGVIFAQSIADVLAAITAVIMSRSVKKDLINF